MKRTDPATDLAERAIRQWQVSGSKIARHDLAKETEVIPQRFAQEAVFQPSQWDPSPDF